MDTAEQGSSVPDLPFDERDMVLAGQVVDIAGDLEFPQSAVGSLALASRTTCLSCLRQ